MPEETTELVFSLDDSIDGRRLSLENVDLPTLGGFLDEIESLIKGKLKGASLAGVRVILESGSIRVRTIMSAGMAQSLAYDLGKLAESSDLDAIQSKRADIIHKWQSRAYHSPVCVYSISVGAIRLEVKNSTRFEHRSENLWVTTRRYLTGEIVDAGGAQDPNLHLLLPNGHIQLIDASKEQIQKQPGNVLYRKITVYVQAEQHLGTKSLRDVSLIQFVQPPEADVAADFTELWRKGERAWADVQSVSDWVEEMRGNE